MNDSASSRAAGLAPVSVVVPCYRCAGTVERAVRSVAAQTRRPAELILVDDASPDDTAQALEALRDRYGKDWIRILRLSRNEGPATARNAGWETARGEYIAFLDADDSWHPRKLEIQHRVMLEHPDIALSAHRHALGVPADVPPDPAQPRLTDISAAALLWRNRFVTPSVMLRRSIAVRFRSAQRHMEDHLLWLQIAYAGHRIVAIELPLATLHKPAFGAFGQSAQLRAMEYAELGNYRLLHSEGRIGAALLAVLSAWSAAKFLRRLLTVAARRLSGSRDRG